MGVSCLFNFAELFRQFGFGCVFQKNAGLFNDFSKSISKNINHFSEIQFISEDKLYKGL